MAEHVEHLSTVLCTKASKDSGLFSLVGLVDMIVVPNLPQGLVTIRVSQVVYSSWRRTGDPGVTVQQRIMFESEKDGGRVQVAGPHEVDLTKRHLCAIVAPITVLPIRGYGQYNFVVERAAGDVWDAVAPKAGLWVASPEMASAVLAV